MLVVAGMGKIGSSRAKERICHCRCPDLHQVLVAVVEHVYDVGRV